MNNQRHHLDKILQGLAHHEISTIPSILTRLLGVSRDPKAHAADLAAVCELDKATSARLLRAANSVYFATENRDRVDSIKDAIVRIGFGVAEEIILSATVSALMKSSTAIADYTASALWKHSIAVAIAARLIYNQRFRRGSIDPFITGLLHDLGIAIAHQFLYEDGFQSAVVQRFEKQSLLADEEEACMGVTHEQIGEAVAKKWNFPQHLVAVIGHHHDMNVQQEDCVAMIHVIRLAEYLCFIQHLGYSDFSEGYATVLLESRTVLNLDDDTLQSLSDQLAKEMGNLESLGWFSELRLKVR